MNILNIVDGKDLNNNLKIKNNKLDLEIKEDLYIKLDSIKDFKINIVHDILKRLSKNGEKENV